MKVLRFFPFLLLIILLNSCFKNDEAIAPHVKGDVQTDTIPMTINYTYQLYFDLAEGLILSKNNKTISDLGFECSGMDAKSS